jgi:hypothetical protein
MTRLLRGDPTTDLPGTLICLLAEGRDVCPTNFRPGYDYKRPDLQIGRHARRMPRLARCSCRYFVRMTGRRMWPAHRRHLPG